MKYLVVGAGVAGIAITKALLEKEKNVKLLDSGENFSSAIAAGMINPLVFRRMTKSWRLDTFLPVAVSFYRELEVATKSHFFHPITIRRFFSSQQERDFWINRQTTPGFSEYMFPLAEEDDAFISTFFPFGAGRVKQSAYVDATAFLSAVKSYYKQATVLHEETFNYELCNPSDGTYNGVAYAGIIFCEGFQGKYNPFFTDLPLNQTKGEILTVRLEEMQNFESWNRKCFILPTNQQTFRVGSNYQWDTPTTNITEEAKDLILSNLQFLTKEIPVIISQEAGVRPTTLDRRPILGTHPRFNKIHIFNGLGAKGYLQAPELAQELVTHLIDKKPIQSEYAMTRFEQ